VVEVLAKEFGECLSRIEIDGIKRARAVEAHVEVRTFLETRPQLVKWGIDTVLIGSYARRTGIYPGNDVDVFSKLTALDTSSSPREVFDEFADALVSHYGERAKTQARSIKISFTSGFSVDVVPAVRSDNRWAIPSRDQASWGPGRAWMDTNPERLTSLTEARNAEPQISGQGAYVPTVKLARQIRKHALGDNKPGGLYVELATYWAFQRGLSGDSFATIVASLLEALRDNLSGYISSPLIDPALNVPYEPQPEPSQLVEAAGVYAELARKAAAALCEDRCNAAVHWREILGENERGPCFPLPEGCDEFGNTVPPTRVNVGRGSDEARGFGHAINT
jgi:hypothetical protein